MTDAARATTWADTTELTAMPTGAYGDNAGGMTIAGGVAAALYKRATAGESPVVWHPLDSQVAKG